MTCIGASGPLVDEVAAAVIRGLASAVADPTRRQVEVPADRTPFPARVRLDTRREADYYRHGVLPYVLRSLLDPGAST
jgi:aconitate hydratase